MSDAPADRVQHIHAEALARSRDERAAYLDAACADDGALRGEVDSLLDARETMGDFLTRPASDLLGDAGPLAPPLRSGDRVGAYAIEGVLGAGGTCRVYAALQEKPRRRVALKVMRASLATDEARRRFEQEAEILARLEHPDIATIFEAGVHETEDARTPWLAMESVERARTLVGFAEGEDLDVRKKLRLFVRLCRAIQHGHQKGVIHRDLKPENVLVDAGGRLRIIDFGIAKVAGAAGEQEILGTPAYMSPEQCAGGAQALDARSDVYSLGVILYELLTGELPHNVDAVSLPEAMRRIQEDSHTPIESRTPSLGGDVAAIVSKALDRDPRERYASADALADDLERHLEHRPVEARPPGLLYAVGKFARRQRLAFGAILAVLTVAVVGALVSLGLAVEREKQRREAEFEAYVGNVAAAAAALRLHDVADARIALERAPRSLRNWEWRHFHHRLDTSRRVVRLPGKRVLTGSLGPEGRRAVCVTFGPGPAHRVLVMDLSSERPVLDLPYAKKPIRDCVALCPGTGPLVAGLGNGEIELRDSTTGEVRTRIPAHEEKVHAVALTLDGERLATASRDGTAKVYDVATSRLLLTLEGHGDRVIDVAYRPDGGQIATAGREGTIRIWDADSGALQSTLTGHAGSVEGVAWSPDGALLVSGSRDETVRLWDVGRGREVWVGRGHTANVRDVAFAPDGRTVASGSYDRTIRLWEVEGGHPVALLRGHVGILRSLAYTPDASSLVSFSDDGTIRIWDAASRGEVPTLHGHTDRILQLNLDPRGERLLTASFDGTIRLWDLTTRREIAVVARIEEPCLAAYFHDRGEEVLGLTPRGEMIMWSANAKTTTRLLSVGIAGSAVCPRSSRLYVGDCNGNVHVRGAHRGDYIARWSIHDGHLSALATNRAETLLAVGSADGTIRLRRLPDAEPAASARTVGSRVNDLCFGPGDRLASCSADGSILVFEPGTLDLCARLEGHTGQVLTVAFAPDGSRLASGGVDGTIRFWDIATARQVAVLHGHVQAVRCLRFSPDGTTLYSGGGGWEDPSSHVRIWEAPDHSLQESR